MKSASIEEGLQTSRMSHRSCSWTDVDDYRDSAEASRESAAESLLDLWTVNRAQDDKEKTGYASPEVLDL